MNIINFEKLDSTNTYSKKNIEKLADKTVISANLQTNGYGRFNRSWIDLGSENIYMTFVLKPSDRLSEVHANLTQYLSVILCKQFEDLGLSPQIKWPNDVLLNGKKVCGILAETVIKGNILKGIVLGIGVNLNASSENLNTIDRPATSVNIELGQMINKQEFMQKLVENFFAQYHEFLINGFVFIKEDYEKRASLILSETSCLTPSPLEGEQASTLNTKYLPKPKYIKIAVFNKIQQGIFNGFDNDGTLLLLMPDGKIEKINMGEIVE